MIPATPPYHLPTMLGKQYMLSKIVEETPLRVVYAGQQTDIRRDVSILSMRQTITENPLDAQYFLDSARVKASLASKRVGVILELLQLDDRWHLVRERIKGEPLERILASGGALSPYLMARLLRCLFRLCIWMDIEGVSAEDFTLSQCYLLNHDFRLDNPALSGRRSTYATRDYLRAAVTLIAPLLDRTQEGGDFVSDLMARVLSLSQWMPLSAMEFAEDALQFQVEQIHSIRARKPLGD